MKVHRRGKLTISIYTHHKDNKLTSMPGGRISPSKYLKGCSFGDFETGKGAWFYFGVFQRYDYKDYIDGVI